MGKYDNIRMAELVKVEDTGDQLTLIFQDNKTIKINVVDGKLVSEVSD